MFFIKSMLRYQSINTFKFNYKFKICMCCFKFLSAFYNTVYMSQNMFKCLDKVNNKFKPKFCIFCVPTHTLRLTQLLPLFLKSLKSYFFARLFSLNRARKSCEFNLAFSRRFESKISLQEVTHCSF